MSRTSGLQDNHGHSSTDDFITHTDHFTDPHRPSEAQGTGRRAWRLSHRQTWAGR
ncbi:MAG: hypothetical protein O3C28_16410 [Proteobacteria bacterium]|nr:hypothetical protein [Pseudomonadota bacterium]